MSDDWMQVLKRDLQEIEPDLIKLRREMHQAPELSGEEFETTEKLRGLVSEYTPAISVLESGRGFYVDLDLDRQSENRNMPNGGQGASKATPFDELPRIGVRSDIDALPIQDEKDVEYKSCVPSVMHACGHDAHSAIGYGTIIALRRLHDRGQRLQRFHLLGHVIDDPGQHRLFDTAIAVARRKSDAGDR